MDSDFKRLLLAGLIRKEGFLDKYREIVIPEIFSNPVEMFVSSIVNNYYDKFKNPPTFKEIRYLIEKKPTNEDLKEMTLKYLVSLENLDIPDLSFIVEEVIEFGKKELYKKSILQMSEMFEYEEVDSETLREIFLKADSFGNVKKQEKKLDFTEEGFEEWLEYRKTVPAVKSGFDFIDRSLHNEGFVPGNFLLILGGAKMGKSAFLIDLSIKALKNKLNVLYITLEIDRFDAMGRFISNAFGIKLRDIKSMPDEVKSKIRGFRDEISSQLTIIEYPSNFLDIATLRRRIRSSEKKPDIVVIDYCMLMKPLDYKEARFAIGNIPSRLKGIASEEEVIMYSAWQTNRGGWDSELVGSEDIAESSQPVMDVDMIMTLSPHEQSTEERRMIIAKVDRTRIGTDSIATVLRVTKSWKFIESR